MSEETRYVPKSILNARSTRLWGKMIEGNEYPPLFGFTVGSTKNPDSVKWLLKTNIPDDRGDGLVGAFGDITTAVALTTMVRAAAAAKADFKRTFNYERIVDFGGGKKSDKPMRVMSVDVVREAKDGVIGLVVHTYKRKPIHFAFSPNPHHPFIMKSGEVLSPAENSVHFALGWCDLIENLLTQAACGKELTLWGDPTPNAINGRSPVLRIGTYNNTVQLSVWTNDENDKHIESGRIGATVDPISFYAFAGHFDTAARAPAGWVQGVHNYYNPREGEAPEPDGGMKRVSTLMVGRDTNAQAYISIVSSNKDRPVIKFPLQCYKGFTVHDERGKEIPLDKMSSLMCLVFKRVLQLAIAARLTNGYVPPDSSNYSGGGSDQATGSREVRQSGESTASAEPNTADDYSDLVF